MKASLLSLAGLRAQIQKIVHPFVATAMIENDAVTNSKLAQMAQAKVKGRGLISGTGSPQDLGLSSAASPNSVPCGDSSGEIDVNWLANSSLSGNAAVLISRAGAAVSWAQMQVGDQVLIVKAAGTDPVGVRFALDGSFPSTPREGQWCWRIDLDQWFVYSATASGWFGANIDSFYFSCSADVTTSVYLNWGQETTEPQFTDQYGYHAPWACKVIGMQLSMAASGTCTVHAYDDGSAISSGASLSLSSQSKKTSWGLESTLVAADSIIGIKRTSGTVEGPAVGRVFLRRFET